MIYHIRQKTLVLLSLFIVTKTIQAQTTEIFKPPYDSKTKDSAVRKSTFYIKGNFQGIDTGSLILYSSLNKVIDTVPIKNGKVEIFGKNINTELLSVLVLKDYYINTFFVEHANLELNLNMETHKFSVTGGKENNLRNNFNSINEPIFLKYSNYRKQLNKAQDNEDIKTYIALADSFFSVENQFIKNIEQQILKKQFGYYLLSSLNAGAISYSYFEKRRSLFEKLPSSIKNSTFGQEIDSSIKSQKDSKQKLINKTAFDFQLPDSVSNFTSLKDFKGKYVIIDFWASWCVPCLKELPLLRKVSSETKSENIVFISISIDAKRDQWLKAMSKNYIPWLSLLADSKTKQAFNINSIPDKILIDPRGKIIASNLSIYELCKEIAKLKKI